MKSQVYPSKITFWASWFLWPPGSASWFTKMCYFVLAEPTRSAIWAKFASKIRKHILAVPTRSTISQKGLDVICEQNPRVPSRSTNSQIFLLRALVTQMSVTASRKLGIRIRKLFWKLDSRGFPKICSSTPNSIWGERYGFRKIGLLHTPSEIQLFFLLFAFKPSL